MLVGFDVIYYFKLKFYYSELHIYCAVCAFI